MDKLNPTNPSDTKNEIEGIEISVNHASSAFAEMLQGVVINEILADPNPGGGAGDTDMDGTEETEDEFIELFNSSGVDVDISGWTISDNGSSYTFPMGTIIPAGGHVVVIHDWDSPVPQPSYVFEGNLALGNSGDEITLTDGTNTIMASYGSGNGGDDFGSPGDGVSMSRTPDGSDTIDNMATPSPECFMSGTRIRTTEGEKQVEDLIIGDQVLTADNKTIAVKWIGYQKIEVQSNVASPVCIKANTISRGVPSRDLYVSADHALFIDGLLINAGALINGDTIVEYRPEGSFTYFHIELDEHALLLAENMPAESYLPQREDRSTFDNGAEVEGQAEIMLFPLPYPRIAAAYNVPGEIISKLSNTKVQKTA